MSDDLAALLARCPRALRLHGNRSPQDFVDEMALGDGTDVYAEGGVVSTLEREVAELLGKPAAAFMPSGTMAQQIALRVHADRRGVRAFACHPTCHLKLHEDGAHERLHSLNAQSVGDPRSLVTIDDLRSVKESLAAVLLELPQREIGGRLPEWADLQEQVTYVRSTGAALHLDGARLWECTPFYDKEISEIAALFDTVYVSFYKGLGALSGCCLAGDEDAVDAARVWRHRHGGTLWSSWPLAASALGALRRRLPLMPRYYDHALEIAAALREVDGVEVVPETPQAPMMHLHLRTTAERFVQTARALAEDDGIATWATSFAADTPSIRIVELGVGDATLDFSPDEVADVVARFVSA